MKKLLMILLSIIISFSAFPMSVSAATQYTEGTLIYEVEYESVLIVGCFSKEEVVTIPSSIAGLPVNRIQSGAFADDTYIRQVNVPDTISSWPEDAFATSIIVNTKIIATVRGKNCYSMAEALKTADYWGKAIGLKTNISESFLVPSNYDITINLNGYNLSCEEITVEGKLKVQGDGEINSVIKGDLSLGNGALLVGGYYSSVTASAPCIKGGYYVTNPEELVMDGYEVTESDIEGYNYKVSKLKEQYIISATSVLLSSAGEVIDERVAVNSGGGIISEGESIALSTELLSVGAATNLTFVGWYKDEIKEENKITTAPFLSFVPDNSANYISVYQVKEKVKASLTISSDDEVIVNRGGERIIKEGSSYNTGVAKVQVNYQTPDRTLKYWLNTSGHVVSGAESFTMTIVGDTTLIPVSIKKAKKLVTFMSDYSQVVKYTEWDMEETMNIPTVLAKTGYIGIGWKVDGTTYNGNELLEKIREKLNTEDEVTVTPAYEKDGQTATLTIKYYDNTEEKTLSLGKGYKVTAPEVSGKVFNYFTLNGTIISYSSCFTYVPTDAGEAILELIYSDEAAAKTPSIDITSGSFKDGKYKVVYSYDVPDGYRFIETGMYYSKTQEDLDNLRYIYQSNIKTNRGTVVVRVNTDNPVIYARAYVTVITPDGETATIFSGQRIVEKD